MTEEQKTRLLKAGDAAIETFQKVKAAQQTLQTAQKGLDAAEHAFLEANTELGAILEDIKRSPADQPQ